MSNTDIKINSIKVAAPSEMIPGIQDLVANSTRVGSGRMRANFVDAKRTWQIKWTNITNDEAKAILDKIEGRFEFTMTCYDPHKGPNNTRTYYKGDRAWEKLLHLQNGIYHTISVTFIEC